MSLVHTAPRDICVDHCHDNGHIRAVLCRNCNAVEGKIKRLANRGKRTLPSVQAFLELLLQYWEDHATLDTSGDSVLHPTHKTDEEKRVLRNKRARARYAAKKRGV